MNEVTRLSVALSRRRGVNLFLSALCAAGAAAFLATLVSLLCAPLQVCAGQAQHVLWGTLLATGCGLLVGAAAPLFARYPASRLLQRADRAGETGDRLASSHEFQASSNQLAPVLHAQAEACAARIEPRRVYPVVFPRSAYWLLGSLCALLVLSQWDHYPSPTAGEATDLLSDGSASALERLIEKARRGELDDETTRELKKLAALLRDPRPTRKEALSEIQRLTEFLQARKNRSRVRSAELRKAGSSLTGSKLARPAGQSLRDGKFRQAPGRLKALAQQMRDVKGSKLTNQQFDRLAQAWRQAMSQLSPRQLREAFGRIAKGMQGYDRMAAADGLEGLASLLDDLAGQLEQDEALDEMTEELRELEERVAGECEGCEGDGDARAFVSGRSKGKKRSSKRGAGRMRSLFAAGARGGLKAGRGTTRDFQGEQTRTDGQAKDHQVDTVKNRGTRFVTTIVTDNDGSRSQLAESDAFVKLARMAQDAMRRENVPIGYRRYIMKYFDLIRPQDAPAQDEAVQTGP